MRHILESVPGNKAGAAYYLSNPQTTSSDVFRLQDEASVFQEQHLGNTDGDAVSSLYVMGRVACATFLFCSREESLVYGVRPFSSPTAPYKCILGHGFPARLLVFHLVSLVPAGFLDAAGASALPSSYCRRAFLPTLGTGLPLVTPTVCRSRDCWKSVFFFSWEQSRSPGSHLDRPVEGFLRCQSPCQLGLDAVRTRCPQ